jgi:hypothetical protein
MVRRQCGGLAIALISPVAEVGRNYITREIATRWLHVADDLSETWFDAPPADMTSILVTLLEYRRIVVEQTTTPITYSLADLFRYDPIITEPPGARWGFHDFIENAEKAAWRRLHTPSG